MNNYNIKAEVWKDITEFDGAYQISNKGRVRSVSRVVMRRDGTKQTVKDRVMTQTKDKDGYLRVCLRKNGKRYTRIVHRLVAEAFIGEMPKDKHVNHKDENKQNNNVYNLNYLTSKENNNYGTRNQRITKSKTNGKKSKQVFARSLITGEVISFVSGREAERSSNNYFQQGSISNACLGKITQYKGYTWSYEEQL